MSKVTGSVIGRKTIGISEPVYRRLRALQERESKRRGYRVTLSAVLDMLMRTYEEVSRYESSRGVRESD